MKKPAWTFCLVAGLAFLFATSGEATQVKVTTSSPIEQIAADGSVAGVSMATPGTSYSLVRYVPVGANGSPQVLLADSQGQQYRIDLGATDYSPPPTPSATGTTAPLPTLPPMVPATAPAQIPVPAPSTNPSPPETSGTLVHCPGAFSYQAPTGWQIGSGRDYSSARDVRGGDCVALISIQVAGEHFFFNRNDPSLEQFAQNCLVGAKRMSTVASAQQTAEVGDLQPFTTASGWGGFKSIVTVTSGGISHPSLYYFFTGHDKTKIMVTMTCHADQAVDDAPLFDNAMRTLIQE